MSSQGPEPIAPAGVGPFMLTLCRLKASVPERQPQAPDLKPFTFFTSRYRQPGGTELLHLHMGYFESLPYAQQWAQRMRASYPHTVATRVPASLLLNTSAATPSPAPDAFRSKASDALTDSRVLRILETRRLAGNADLRCVPERPEIPLLRPDDTATRQALKEAVVRGAPVSFAVQLAWSAEPIDLGSLPRLDIFEEYTLYLTQTRRENRCWFSVRLGFFSEALYAKQVAYYVRSSFASVAVVPVHERERVGAKQNPIAAAALMATPGVENALPVTSEEPLRAPVEDSKHTAAPSSSEAPSGRDQEDGIEDTLEVYVGSEFWYEPDPRPEKGVRDPNTSIPKQDPESS